MTAARSITLRVNGTAYERNVEPRLLLADFLRQTLGLTGTHVGCEHGVCGACTIMVDGDSVRSCLMLAVQAEGCEITTVEGLGHIERLSEMQQAFHAHHALQCGFCTPGMLITTLDLLEKYALATDDQIRDGYEHIVRAVRELAGKR
jgi:carbon-monoxide dehydrogenase small subunit